MRHVLTVVALCGAGYGGWQVHESRAEPVTGGRPAEGVCDVREEAPRHHAASLALIVDRDDRKGRRDTDVCRSDRGGRDGRHDDRFEHGRGDHGRFENVRLDRRGR